ncbi:MAG: hypothetical protein JW934_20875 [Anaerolineae bacterium]|nr:hypothetical protein [Anaerolineae bacterium]
MALFQVTGKLSVYDLGPYGRQLVPDSLRAIRWRDLASDEHHALRLALWQCAHCGPLDVAWEVGPEVTQLGEDLHMRHLGAPELNLEA